MNSTIGHLSDEESARKPDNVSDSLVYKRRLDVVDAPPRKISFGCWDVTVYIFSIILFVFDVVTDGVLAYFYYSEGYLAYFGLTICFTVIPSITIALLSFKWYWCDRTNDKRLNLSNGEWFAVYILHILQLGPVMRYYMTIKYGRRSIKASNGNEVYFRAMLWEATDVCLLRLIETFMESAPQLVLQLYILARNSQLIRWHVETAFIAGVPHNFIPVNVPDTNVTRAPFFERSKNDPFLGQGPKTTVIIQGVSILISLTSLAWTLTAYARNARFVMEKKKNLSVAASICHFFWHFWTIAARVLALALFASIFSFWVGVGCFLRFAFMFGWLMCLKKNFCEDKCLLDLLFKCVIAFVYLFSFLNLIDEPTKYKYLLFYTYEFVENCLYISLWFCFGDRETWFYYPAIGSYWAFWILGTLFMFLYYCACHPSKQFHFAECCKRLQEPDTSTKTISRVPSRKEPHRVNFEEFDWISDMTQYIAADKNNQV